MEFLRSKLFDNPSINTRSFEASLWKNHKPLSNKQNKAYFLSMMFSIYPITPLEQMFLDYSLGIFWDFLFFACCIYCKEKIKNMKKLYLCPFGVPFKEIFEKIFKWV
jgi:hypothetical protein